MQFLKNNFWTFFLVAGFALLAMTGDASAQAASVMDTAAQKAKDAFGSVKTILFIVGGFGLVGVAWGAIFGKINWKWFAALAVGLAILAAANSIVNYATGKSVGFEDSFSAAGK